MWTGHCCAPPAAAIIICEITVSINKVLYLSGQLGLGEHRAAGCYTVRPYRLHPPHTTTTTTSTTTTILKTHVWIGTGTGTPLGARPQFTIRASDLSFVYLLFCTPSNIYLTPGSAFQPGAAAAVKCETFQNICYKQSDFDPDQG